MEEQVALKSAYVRSEGDMDRVIASLTCCTLSDVQRHCYTLDALIDSGQLTRYKAYTRSAAELRRRAANASRQVPPSHPSHLPLHRQVPPTQPTHLYTDRCPLHTTLTPTQTGAPYTSHSP